MKVNNVLQCDSDQIFYWQTNGSIMFYDNQFKQGRPVMNL